MTYEELLCEVRALPTQLRHQLLSEAIVDDSVSDETLVAQAPKTQRHKLMEFAGVGAHLYDGTDAQEYVNSLRDECDNRS